MSLPQQLVGPEPEGAVLPGGKPGCLHRFRGVIRMPGKESRHRFLVLLGGKGAGGVHQPSAGPEHLRRRVQNFPLPPGAHLHQLRGPVRHRRRFFAEHALPGAGRVHQNPVKKAGKPLGQGRRGFVQDQGVGNPHPLYVLGKDFCPLGVNLVAHQQAPAPHLSGNLGGLAPGGGAKVQNPLPGLWVQEHRRGHGAGLLKIVDPRVVEGVQAGSGLRVIVVPRFLPGHRGFHKGQRGPFPLLGVKPESHRPGPFQAGKIFRELGPQLGLHPLQKQFRQHMVSPMFVSF